MRKDNHLWDAPTLSPVLNRSGLSVRQVRPKRMTVLSGPYSAILKAIGLKRAYGWPGAVSGEPYALRLRRDRVLLVNGPELTDGWDEKRGLAISDMTGAYAVFEIEGSEAFDFLRRGTEIDQRVSSASVNRSFHGMAAMIYAWEKEACFRLHVTSPMATAWWTLAQKLSEQMDNGPGA